MKTIKLRFISSRSLVGKIIRWITWSDWNHVDLILDDTTAFGASGKLGKVTRYSRNPDSHCHIAIVSIPVSDKKYDIFMEEVLSKEGALYDHKGIHGFLVRLNIHEDDKWFCSELLIDAMYKAEIIYFTEHAHKWSPDHMWKAISFCTSCEIEYVK